VFLMQEGEAFWRAGKLPMALKRFNAIAQVSSNTCTVCFELISFGLYQIFDDMWDDQFDFHSYCIRRYTLNTYSEYMPFLIGLSRF
jgi:hypothetical protein